MENSEHLREQIKKKVKRMTQAEKDKPTLLAQTVFLGTLALLFVLPVIGGVYFGHWIDTQMVGYSYRWTIIFLVIGLFIGGMNVYLYIRRN